MPGPKGGWPPKITPDYLKRLFSIIEQDPRNLGFPFSNWTAPLLAEYLAQETGIHLDESRIRHYLHVQDYELLRPVLTVASPDPEYNSKRVRIEDLQRQAERGEIDLYYEDEIDLALLPTYSLQLNPVERFWKHLRRKVTHNAFFQTIDRLLDAVIGFFQDLAARSDIVRSVTGLAA